MANATKYHKTAAYLFVCATLTLMLIPFVGMLWAPNTSTAENRTLASVPALLNNNGAININVVADAGAYFNDHFAYRSQLVTANAKLYTALGSSSNTQVVVGQNNWLYYTGTLPDYLGQNTLSERALRNIAHNLALLQGFAEAHGAQFVFALAPNKNSLYPTHMPTNYLPSQAAHNWESLKPYLEEYKVNYVDLFAVLDTSEEELYYARDTHWNNQGALLGGNAILAAIGHETVNVAADSWVERNDYTGDLATMLYPTNPGSETASYALGYNDGEGQTGTLWTWTSGQSVEDGQASTRPQASATNNASGVLVMYRDSFANALIPYYAATFEEATFTKMVPYDAGLISNKEANYVIVERAERHLDYLAQYAPIMPAPAVKLAANTPTGDTSNAAKTSLQVKEDGGYTVVSGELDPKLWQNDIEIYLEVPTEDGTRVYKASAISAPGTSDETADFENTVDENATTNPSGTIAPISSDYGFVVYLPGTRDFSNKTLRVICIQKDSVAGVASFPR